jgi:signal transduction histidine kinase/CheY-like chemotaxis protein
VEADKRITQQIDDLAQSVADNPIQVSAVNAIRPLISDRIAFAQNTVQVRQRGDFEGARKLLSEGRGLQLMEDLRKRFDGMQDEENGLLAARTAALHSTINWLLAAIALGVLTTVYVLTVWITTARRNARELAQTNQILRETIAEREAAEHQIRQMQKMEAIGQLTGGIAHDFNNMLAVIVSGISLARRRLEAGRDGVDGFLASSVEGAQKAAALVSRLLAFSRQQTLSPRPIDANRFVAGISELIARALGESIRMETILGGGLWTTYADHSQLETAILNLSVNAKDAMPEGGRLTLETANCHLDDRYSRLHPGVPPGQYVLIAVTDTGTGMPPEVAAKAFDPFYTTKEVGKGTGLGLSQVFGFVKQSGGHVKIYSEPGEGTTIKIYLPRFLGQAEAATESVETQEFRGTETILVVEDDPAVLDLTVASLRELGYEVLQARNAKDGLNVLAAHQDIALMVTDIVMPDLNGRKLADQALQLMPDLKILFMTGFTKNAVVHNGVLDSGVHFLAKPFTIDELSRKVREAIETTTKR